MIPLLVHSANSRYRDGIAAVLPNPEGRDAGREVVTLDNSTGADVELSGWTLRDRAGNEFLLSGQVRASTERAVTMSEFSMPLNNSGDRIRLVRPEGSVEHAVRYDGAEVAEGEPIRIH